MSMAGTFSLSEPTIDPPVGMPCTQCARGAKFWMSANTRTLVSAPFHRFLVPCQGFFRLGNFLELGQFGSPNSKGVSKGCAWGLFGGNIV